MQSIEQNRAVHYSKTEECISAPWCCALQQNKAVNPSRSFRKQFTCEGSFQTLDGASNGLIELLLLRQDWDVVPYHTVNHSISHFLQQGGFSEEMKIVHRLFSICKADHGCQTWEKHRSTVVLSIMLAHDMMLCLWARSQQQPMC